MSDPPLHVEVERGGRAAIVAARGEIDVATVGMLEQALEDAIGGDAYGLVLDLRQLEFIDSGGARAVIRAHQQLVESNRQMAIVAPPGPVRRVFALLNIDEEIAVRDTRNAAYEALVGA